MHNIKRQQGGTILGLIIGLIIGLGIALAVAVAITKTPMPFTDKSGRQKGFEPNGGEIPDPNKSMYRNKGAAKEAAKDFPRKWPVLPESTATQKPADKKPEIRVEARPDGKPMVIEQAVDKPKAETAAAPDSADDKWSYYLQAGAFREQTDAESMRAKLALQGVEARISERHSENGVLYRVRVGPFGDLDAMNKVRGKLSDNGVDAAVVRIAK